MEGYRQQVGVRLGDQLSFQIIGKRKHGSFRAALREYGMERREIDRVIADLDCDRDVIIQRGAHRHEFRAL